MPLHPQSQSFLDAVAAKNAPAWSDMPIAQGREVFSGLTDLFGTGPELRRVEDVSTDSGVPLRIYQADTTRPRPVVMFFHGGGWVLGDIETHDTLCRHLAAESGLAIVSVDYRRAPEHPYPAAFDDCFAATQFVAEHSDQLGVAARKLAVAGDSAGGNLAAAVALKSRDADGPPIQGQLLIYPVLNREFDGRSYVQFAEGFGLSRAVMMWFWEQYLGANVLDAYASPVLAESLVGLPQTHVITAEYDVLRDEGKAFAELLTAAGVATNHRCYDGMLHAFMHFTGAIEAGREAISDAAEVLRGFVSGMADQADGNRWNVEL